MDTVFVKVPPEHGTDAGSPAIAGEEDMEQLVALTTVPLSVTLPPVSGRELGVAVKDVMGLTVKVNTLDAVLAWEEAEPWPLIVTGEDPAGRDVVPLIVPAFLSMVRPVGRPLEVQLYGRTPPAAC